MQTSNPKGNQQPGRNKKKGKNNKKGGNNNNNKANDKKNKNNNARGGTRSLSGRLSFLASCVGMTTSLTCALEWKMPQISKHRAQLCSKILYQIIKI